MSEPFLDDDLDELVDEEDLPSATEAVLPPSLPRPGVGRAVDLVVMPKTAGMRLDKYLVLQFPDFSRSLFQDAIAQQAVTINDKPAKASSKLHLGDRVRIWLPEPRKVFIEPQDIPLTVLYEDEWLALIDKPYDMVVHPAKGNWSGTLANALEFRFGHLSRVNGVYRPGIVHRLDRDTSGVILVAKDEAAHRDLAMQFETRKIFKEYVAITAGVLDRDSDYIEKRIGHHPHDRIKMAVFDDDRGKESCTFYEVLERFPRHTYVRLHPRTGRTHQLRVHLASVGCPVLADKLYGGRDRFCLADLSPGVDPAEDEVFLPRQALHAARLRFQHPVLKKPLAVEAPLPRDMARTLEALRRDRSERRT